MRLQLLLAVKTMANRVYVRTITLAITVPLSAIQMGTTSKRFVMKQCRSNKAFELLFPPSFHGVMAAG